MCIDLFTTKVRRLDATAKPLAHVGRDRMAVVKLIRRDREVCVGIEDDEAGLASGG
jgi:hypothetical protein